MGQKQDGSAHKTGETDVICIAAACSDLQRPLRRRKLMHRGEVTALVMYNRQLEGK